jgi:hypothetical protein
MQYKILVISALWGLLLLADQASASPEPGFLNDGKPFQIPLRRGLSNDTPNILTLATHSAQPEVY